MSQFEKAPVVILSSVEWNAAWQRHQIFAAQWAERGRDVFFIENSGFRNPGLRDLPRVWGKLSRAFGTMAASLNPAPEGLRVINPWVLPPTDSMFRRINASLLLPRLQRQLELQGLNSPPIAFIYMPTATTLELLERLSPALTIYDCASHFAAHPRAPADFPELEQRLLSRADLVVTDSDFLAERLRPRHPQVFQVHQGVSPEFFEAAPPFSGFNRFCYYGSWVPDLDPDFLTALAEAGLEVTISGFIKAPTPESPAIRRLGPVPREKLVRRLENFDAFLMPHKLTPFHQGVLPAKLYECFAMGRPILATPLPSLKAFKDLVYLAETPEQWVEIARELPKTETPEKRKARVLLAKEHTHEREFARLSERVREAWEMRASR